MNSFNIIRVIVILSSITTSSCWQFFTSVSDLTLSNSAKEPVVIHSEYIYGHCRLRDTDKIIFYAHVHFDHLDVLGKIIMRGWLNFYRIPTCIILRATAFEEDTFRSTAYNFQICVPRITYCHSKQRYKYYYYEWYIPADYIGGMNWDMYFYGPPNPAW